MNGLLVSILVILTVTYSSVLAISDAEIPDDFNLDDLDDVDSEYDLLREFEKTHLTADLARENDLASKIAADVVSEQAAKAPVQIDPCSKIRCGAGRVCKAEETTASCVCIPECPEETDPRRKVCTNKNETWNSDCEVYRQRCLCDSDDIQCMGPEFKHIHIDYYGNCKEMPECTEEEMNDFPRRMRDWLFNVMRDLAERDELSDHYKTMQIENETNLTRRWANAAVWKWCDLDGHPHDRSVSRHELFPIRAPLMSLEHCIAPFLESCDPNDDHRITLKEWGSCLELNEEDMLNQCDEINEDKKLSKATVEP